MKYASNTKSDRNLAIVKLRQTDSDLSLKDIGKLFGISKARVSQIISRNNGDRNCSNCFHQTEPDGLCACREMVDMVHTPNKCQDWIPRKG